MSALFHGAGRAKIDRSLSSGTRGGGIMAASAELVAGCGTCRVAESLTTLRQLPNVESRE
ncbi:MAG: hypothetical protein ACRCZ8_06935 [Aeromonas sobria]